MLTDRPARFIRFVPLVTALLVAIVAPETRAQDIVEAITGTATPEAAPATVPAGLSAPHHTLSTFVEAMGTDPPDYETGLSCVEWGATPRDARNRLVEKLYGIIIRIEDVADSRSRMRDSYLELAPDDIAKPFFPRPSLELPTTAAMRRQRFVQKQLEFAEVTGEIGFARTDAGAWLFSPRTVASIEPLYDALRNLDVVAEEMRDERELSSTLAFEESLPAWARDKTFGLKIWQWIGIAALIFIGLVLDLTVRLWLRIVSRRIIERRGGDVPRDSLRRTVRPFGLAAAAMLWLLVMPMLDLPVNVLRLLGPAVRLFAMLACVWALWRLTDLVAEVFISRASRTASKFDDLLVPLIRKATKVFIAVFGLIYVANSLDVPIAPLLTGLGIGGAGFAFAAKDTLEHFFGSLTVIADRPFQVGDWVTIGDVEGTVEEVGIRSTRIRTFYNSLVSVPNGNLVRAVVDNYGLRKYRRWSTHLTITYATAPEKIDAFCEGVREIIRLHPFTRKDYYQVWLHGFGTHSLDILLYVFFQTPDWQTELRERHRLMLDVIRLADRLGVEFAFPTQTIHMQPADADGTPDTTPTPDRETERRAFSEGRRIVHELVANSDWRRQAPGAYRFLSAADTANSDTSETPETQIESRVGGDA